MNQPLILEKPVAQPTRVFYVLDLTPSHEYVWEIDGYRIKDGTTGHDMWTLHVQCPKCNRNLTIECSKKPMEIGPESLSVERFTCTWPAEFGGVCGYSAAIEPPKGSQKTTVTHDGVRRRVDGIFKRG